MWRCCFTRVMHESGTAFCHLFFFFLLATKIWNLFKFYWRMKFQCSDACLSLQQSLWLEQELLKWPEFSLFWSGSTPWCPCNNWNHYKHAPGVSSTLPDLILSGPLKEAKGGKSSRSKESVQHAGHEWPRFWPKNFYFLNIGNHIVCSCWGPALNVMETVKKKKMPQAPQPRPLFFAVLPRNIFLCQ